MCRKYLGNIIITKITIFSLVTTHFKFYIISSMFRDVFVGTRSESYA